MQKDVTQGKSYCLTVYSVPCKVTAIGENNIEYTLVNATEQGQYLFIAPTWKVDISQNDASLVETFNLAGTGKISGSGSGSDPTYGFLKIVFVDALPPISEAKENTLYFVPKTTLAIDNYDEYIFDPVHQEFELVGSTSIDTADFAKLSATNIFLAPNTFSDTVVFEKGIKLSGTGPALTRVNDRMMQTDGIRGTTWVEGTNIGITGKIAFEPSFSAASINHWISRGVTGAGGKLIFGSGTESIDNKVFSYDSNSVEFYKDIIVSNNIISTSGKIQTPDNGAQWTIGNLTETPEPSVINLHRLRITTGADKLAYIIRHERSINGVWVPDKIIPACQFDFTWHNDASIFVKTPTKDTEASNKIYVDTAINNIVSGNQNITGQWDFTGPITVSSPGTLAVPEPTAPSQVASFNTVITAFNKSVKLTDDQTIAGIKTFENAPICSDNPSTSDHLTNKLYVDNAINALAERIKVFEDIKDKLVLTDTDQTITGTKTFVDTVYTGTQTIQTDTQTFKWGPLDGGNLLLSGKLKSATGDGNRLLTFDSYGNIHISGLNATGQITINGATTTLNSSLVVKNGITNTNGQYQTPTGTSIDIGNLNQTAGETAQFIRFKNDNTLTAKMVCQYYNGTGTTTANARISIGEGDQLILNGTEVFVSNKKITGLANGTKPNDAAAFGQIPTNYVTTDTEQTITGTKTFNEPIVFENGINLSGSQINNLAPATIDTDAVNMSQLPVQVNAIQKINDVAPDEYGNLKLEFNTGAVSDVGELTVDIRNTGVTPTASQNVQIVGTSDSGGVLHVNPTVEIYDDETVFQALSYSTIGKTYILKKTTEVLVYTAYGEGGYADMIQIASKPLTA